MCKRRSHSGIRSLWLAFFMTVLIPTASRGAAGTLRGRVRDPLGQTVPNCHVTLLQNGAAFRDTHIDGEGNFEYSPLDGGRYAVRVEARGFANHESPA